MVNPVHLPKIIPRPHSSAELHIGSKGVNWSTNLTFRCVKCKYPHHFESDDLQGRASVSFSCTGCGTPQEVELSFKMKSREFTKVLSVPTAEQKHEQPKPKK
jgi:ribosomal protein L44E